MDLKFLGPIFTLGKLLWLLGGVTAVNIDSSGIEKLLKID